MNPNPPTDYKDYKCTSAFMRINCSTLFAGVNYTVYMYMYYMYIGQRIRLESLNNRLIIQTSTWTTSRIMCYMYSHNSESF